MIHGMAESACGGSRCTFVVDEGIGIGFDVLPGILYSIVSGIGAMAKF